MSTSLIILVTFCYVGVAASETWHGNYGMGIVFFGYSVANIGLIMGLS
jgi:hypothetical protein